MAQVGSTPLTDDNRWQTVTVENIADCNGPALKRIGVPGGWLYVCEPSFPHNLKAISYAPVFVVADRT